MTTTLFRNLISVTTLALLVVPFSACEKQPEPAKPAAPAAANPPAVSQPAVNKDGHGATTALGEQAAGAYTVKASRDGDITPGKDVPIDVWVTGAGKIAAVRFWIGSQDAKGSIKAKAELETDNWHTHAEVPSPLPEGSKLWVEVESDTGEKTQVGFGLKV